MDPEKSNSSSFEDLSYLKDTEQDEVREKEDNEVLDIIGNGQIRKRIIKKSDNDIQPQYHDAITINLVGKLENGTIVEKKDNFDIHVGDFEVVQGVDITLVLMKEGEIAEIEVIPRFAYGSLGLKNDKDPSASIPPDAKIFYTVELIKCHGQDEVMPFKLRKRYGNRKRERANFWFNRNEFNTAIQLYRRAIHFLDVNVDQWFGVEETLSNSEVQELLEDKIVVYNNLAMAQIKILAHDAALSSVETVLKFQPNNSKALYRKGRILDIKGETKAAISLLQKAATLEPESKSIQYDLSKLIMKSRREERNEKEMYQKMLGQAKKLEQKNIQSKPERNDMPKLKLLGYFMGSILIGVAGAAMYRYKY